MGAQYDNQVRLQRMIERAVRVVDQSRPLLERTAKLLNESQSLSRFRVKRPDIYLDQNADDRADRRSVNLPFPWIEGQDIRPNPMPGVMRSQGVWNGKANVHAE